MHIFGLGNPLLDITAKVEDSFLEKYGLPKNSAILAEAKHETMYDEVINKFEIEYSAGGATQNTMRFCQWVVGKNNQVTTFVGSVGNDYFGKIME
ncbi:PREDICTED: adenosine kinase-like, partial [Rhagoletis zephyria]|uniref:adenosine kinase-like n=1 Tax=Rhagoletis zephyria TaxID=28612 RepID=UPI000811637B